MLPLYADVQKCRPKQDDLKTAGHAGLWFERFYDCYAADFSATKTGDNDFRDWLQGFHYKAGDADALERMTQQQLNLVSALQGRYGVFRCTGRFVSGMGNNHPLENGFDWHPVLGVPYLPGSALKGLVRAWVEAWEYADDDEASCQRQQQLRDWFGSDTKDSADVDALRTGQVIFFDAIPLHKVTLTTEIMTPHVGDWYAAGAQIESVVREPENVPADWHSPNPIPFLSAKAPVFLVSLALRGGVPVDAIDLSTVMECVEQAFLWLGAGAKTAVGFGEFVHDDALTEEQESVLRARLAEQEQQKKHAAALEGLSGFPRELQAHGQQMDWDSSGEAFIRPGEIDVWLGKLKDSPDKHSVMYLRDLFDKHFPELLTDPEKMKGKKMNKAVFSKHKQIVARQFNAISDMLDQ